LLLTLLAARGGRPSAERCRFDVECYPGVPYYRHILWKAAFHAGAKLLPYHGGDPGGPLAARPRLRLFWTDFSVTAGPAAPPPPEWRCNALNGRMGDVSKRNVERVFAGVFGYALAFDPTTHVGPCVAKSNRDNSAHDGRVIDCPVAEADPELAYERLVDNRVDQAALLDLRVPVVGGAIPFVYRKHRPLHDRFSNTNLWVGLAAAEEVFSGDERELLRAFCGAMGLSLGELDVLRDTSDGRIYVVDVNPTAWGPPRPLRTADASRAVRAYAAAFIRLAERTIAADEGHARPPV
jgi:hypothetical protein